MTRYLENLNECTDPVSGDMFPIYDASAGATDKDRRVDVGKFAQIETGSWTPALQFGGGTVGITYSWRVGEYVKVGNMVNFTGSFALTAKGTVSTGAAAIGGLPFTAVNTANQINIVTAYWAGMTTSYVAMFGYINPGSGSVGITGGTAAMTAPAGVTDTGFAATSTFRVQGFYFTT